VAQTPQARQTLFFSATLDGEVGRLADAYTVDARRHEHRTAPERRGDIEHEFIAVRHDAKQGHLVDVLSRDGADRTLVFVRTKRGADRLVKRLEAHGVRAAAMHANKSQSQRERALARFESGACRVLVATDIAARGLDVDDISHIVNFDAPEDRDSYVHRAWRTGRAGRRGVSITFVLAEQAGDMSRVAGELSLQHEFAAAGLRPGRAAGHGTSGPSGHQRKQPVRGGAPSGRALHSARPSSRPGGGRRRRTA
jgi:superfamily II DNA/RNA helicase